MSRKHAPNIKNTPITRDKWDKMLKAYRDRPTITYLVEVADVGRRTARRAVMEGWPDLGLPPFIELANAGTSVHKEMAITRESWEEAAITQGEAARTAAEEALAARTVMSSAVRAVQIAEKLSMSLLKRLEEDPDGALPEVFGPKDIKTIIDSIQKSAAAVETALKIERMRAGEPEAILGIQIGMMLERLTDDELEIVVTSGCLPDRLVDQRNTTIAQLTEDTHGTDTSINDAKTSITPINTTTEEQAKFKAESTSESQPQTYKNTPKKGQLDTADTFLEDMKKHLGLLDKKGTTPNVVSNKGVRGAKQEEEDLDDEEDLEDDYEDYLADIPENEGGGY